MVNAQIKKTAQKFPEQIRLVIYPEKYLVQ